MTAPTHVVGGISAMAFISLLVPTYRINLTHIIIGAVCAMLPDIDNPKAFIGRLFFFISGPIDRKFGHRTITHSFFALFLLGATTYLTLFIYSHSLTAFLPIVFTIMLAYFSHLFLDAMTKQGILAYYPSRLWGVFPTRASWRIRTGTRIELLYFAILTITSLIFLPLGQTGMVHAFNRLFLAGGSEARLKEFEVKKQKASLGFTVEQIDSLLKVRAIDPKQAQELKAKILEIEAQEEKFKNDQGLNNE
jgi:inner membrane protein